jgi:hypothetical protein
MKIEKLTILLKHNHYIKCFCFIQNVANKNTNKKNYYEYFLLIEDDTCGLVFND